MQSSELRRLLNKYIDNSISAEEFAQLWKTLSERQFDGEWDDAIQEVLDNKKFHGLSDPDQVAGQLARIRAKIDEPLTAVPRKTFVHHIKPRVIRYAAAALLLLASGIYLVTRNTAHSPAMTAARAQAAGTVRPGTQKATLTLADGTTIMLDSLADGKIAQQGATQVLKLANGRLQYQASAPANKDRNMFYNIMSTPKGGQYQLTLPDGSNVWLNAASSITYPIAFTGNERSVKITGEVYFEVAKDKHKPFRVTAGDQEIEVLGTHFNINAYSDEDHIKTSLLEGSIKVNRTLLQPGQAFTHGEISSTDVDQDIAWKNGIFNFENQTLPQVMRQLARWYDLEVVYPQGIPKKKYGGEMGRDLTLDQVLKGLENSGVHFQLNGRRLIISS